MLRSSCCCFALWWLLLLSVEAAEEETAADKNKTTTLFRAAETDVLRFRHSRDENGKGNESHLRDALAKYNSLQQHPEYVSSLSEETRVLVLDSCEFCHRTLGEYDAALRYAKQLADSRLCQQDAGGCFASVASRIILRLRSIGRADEATDYFNQAMAVAPAEADTDGDATLLHWTSEWQIPAWFVPGLTAKPWWEEPDADTGAAAEPPSLVEVREVLRAHFMDLQGELIRLATLASRMERDGVGKLFELQMDYELVTSGHWSEYLLYDDGQWFDHRCELVPTICQVMSSIAAVAGVVQGFDETQAPGQVTILRMEGGTILAPHCGPRNSRLTAHLPLIVPEIDESAQGSGVGLRVGLSQDEGEAWRRWEEGEVLIFDDSFEHEARWPEATAEAQASMLGEYDDGEPGGARYILYASLWHPDLGEPTLPEERKWPGPELAEKYEEYYAEEQMGAEHGAGSSRKGRGRGKKRKAKKEAGKSELR